MSEEAVAVEAVAPTTEAPAAEAKVESAPQMFTVKVDGEDVEVSLDDLMKGYSTQSAAMKKFNDAAKMRQQSEAFIKTLQSDPWTVMKELGLNPRELAEHYLVAQLEEEMLDPKDREVRDMKKKLSQYEEMEKAAKQAEEQQKMAELYEKTAADIQTNIIGALEKSGLPKSDATIARAAYYMNQILSSADYSDEVKANVTFDDIMDLVRKDYEAEIRSLFGNSSIEQLVKIVGDEPVKKIRQWDIERVKRRETPKTPENQPAPKTKGKEPNKKLSAEEFRKYLESMK